jgi:hypothetical protein
MKIGDLVYYQAQGFNSTSHQPEDGLATVITLSYSPQNGKSGDTAKIFLHKKGEIFNAWRKQVGLLEEKTDVCCF